MYRVELFWTNNKNEQIRNYISKKGYISVNEKHQVCFYDSEKRQVFRTSVVRKADTIDNYYIVETKNSNYRFKLL